jgi:3-hydroxyacyl-CoA dehydrogenase
MKLKQAIFSELEKLCSERTILATNTSSLSLSEMAGNLKKKDRFVACTSSTRSCDETPGDRLRR